MIFMKIRLHSYLCLMLKRLVRMPGAWLLLHLLLLAGMFLAYRAIQHEPLLPEAQQLYNSFDVIHYHTIATEGYSYHSDAQSNVAFFPGFPYLWKYSGLGSYGICILNILLFYTGYYLLSRHFRFSRQELLLGLSLPPMLFMYVPYSEALFFLTSVPLLIGLSRKNAAQAMPGFFTSSLVRSAANIFLPAVVLTEWLSAQRSLKRFILYLFSCVLAVFLVSCFQHYQTGEWLGFIKTQKYWFHGLAFPKLPFHTWGQVILLDGAALIAGLLMIGMTLFYIYRFLFKKERSGNDALFFSLLVVSGLTFFAIIFKGGMLFSLNRYIIPTAFFVLAMALLRRRFVFLSAKHWGLAVLGIFILSVPLHFFAHIRIILEFLAVSVYLSLYFPMKFFSPRGQMAIFYGLYILNCLIQVYLLDQFLQGHWIA
jgi:hypothetical protein